MTKEVAQAGEVHGEQVANVGDASDYEFDDAAEGADGALDDVLAAADAETTAGAADVVLDEVLEDAVEDAVENQSAEDAGVIEQLSEELAAAQAQVDEYIDKLQRTAADFQNTQRRQQKQLADSIDRANADLIRRLLPVLDDFDLAFQNAPQPPAAQADEDAGSAWIDGFRQIQKKLLDLLQEQGVSPIDADGEFDPMRHEAVLSEQSDEVESGHIVGVLRSGYEYKGQVLRPAMVRVAA